MRIRPQVWCLLLLPAAGSTACQQPSAADPVAAATAPADDYRVPTRPVHTYSILAVDKETGEIGVAAQSHWFSVGSRVIWAEAGVGAVVTQSYSRTAYGPELLADIKAGKDPAEALAARIALDTGADVRQVGVIDLHGGIGAFSGKRCIAEVAQYQGDGFLVIGNILANDEVVQAMADAFIHSQGPLAERLVAAMDAANSAGGDLRGRQSAALKVVSGEATDQPSEGVVVDIRVDDHHRPMAELARLLRIHRAYKLANLGDEAVAQNDIETATLYYQQAEELYPEQVELSYWRGYALLKAGFEEEALRIFQHVFAEEPAWVEMAPRLMAADHLPKDEALLARIAALAPRAEAPPVPMANQVRIERDIRKLAGFGTRHTLSDTADPERGIGAARRWLADELRRISDRHHGGRLQVALESFQIPAGRRIPDGVELANVVATLPGTDPDRLLVISGHYDSRASDPMDARSDAPGANDDASGVAAVMEAARLLGGLKPQATVVFLAVAGEEQGLLGARAQAEKWKAEGKLVEAMITMDIVGGSRGSSGKHEPWRLRAFSEGVPTAGPKVVGSDNDAPSRQLARYFARVGEEALPGFDISMVFRQDRYLRGGDHKAFNDNGWAAIRLTEPHENYSQQHQDVRVEEGLAYGDLADFVDFGYVGRVTTVVATTLHELALAPAAPTQVSMDTSGLTPSTTLRWEPSEGAAGYAVLYRRSHEPTWSYRRVVGDEPQVTLEGKSKDDWLFAVEAFGPDGHRSLPVYPSPRF
ncbi:MAG: M20/M25/M40 family metallo-hydrolase [Planctomycetes bacterium]|nr:M20/M25/M40 family metallo-hydrolase [Planctomycetota bacterium]